MKFFLTIYICSSIVGNCFIHESTPKPQDTYYDCVRNGLSESYEILYQGKISEQDMVKFKMYPKFACEEVIVPLKTGDREDNFFVNRYHSSRYFRLVTYNIN